MVKRQQPLTLDELVRRKIRLPPCPAIFSRLISLLEGESHRDEVAIVISSDLPLTTQVLRVANSAFYGLSRRVRSVDEALLRLGFSEVCSIAFALKSRDMFQSGDERIQKMAGRLREHSLKTAILVRAMSRRLNPKFAHVFFTAGILHDVGKAALLEADADYVTLCSEGTITGATLVALEKEAYGIQHAVLGGELLEYWNLPQTLVKLVAGHHDPVAEDDGMKNTRCLLTIGDEMAHALGAGDDDGMSFGKSISESLLASLLAGANLDMESWLSLVTDCQHQLQALKSV